MKNRIFILALALLALCAVTFAACTGDTTPEDTTDASTASTEAPTAAPTEPEKETESSSVTEDSTEVNTEASTDGETTDASTDEVTTEATTGTSTDEATTEEATGTSTDEATTEESTDASTSESTDATTEEVTEEATTEEVTTEEVTEPESLTVDLENVTISSSLDLFESHFTTADKDSCVDDLVDIFGDPVIKDGVKIPLVYQGAINLGNIDLSKYKKVTVTYATSASPGTIADYETTQKRAMLTNVDTKGDLSPFDEFIVASAFYNIPATTWMLTTVEIDLTNVDYSGEVFLTFDFTSGVNLYHAVTGVVFEG